MSLSEPEDCVPLLRSGDLDLGIVFESAVKHADDGIHRVHLLEDPMYLVLPRDHPLANRRRVRLGDLAGEAWIGGQPDCECNRLISRACAIAGYEPRFAFETDDYTAMQGFVAAGVGVSLIAELGLTTVRDDIVVRDLGRDTPVRQIYAATLAEGYRSPATQAMLEILRDVASAYESRRPRLELVG
jgi:DNA-binding transcriptional LysR family regulator